MSSQSNHWQIWFSSIVSSQSLCICGDNRDVPSASSSVPYAILKMSFYLSGFQSLPQSEQFKLKALSRYKQTSNRPVATIFCITMFTQVLHKSVCTHSEWGPALSCFLSHFRVALSFSPLSSCTAFFMVGMNGKSILSAMSRHTPENSAGITQGSGATTSPCSSRSSSQRSGTGGHTPRGPHRSPGTQPNPPASSSSSSNALALSKTTNSPRLSPGQSHDLHCPF